MAKDEEAGVDEMYCSSCGEIIKEEAEICPECGVRQNAPSNPQNTNNTSNTGSTSNTSPGEKDRTTAAILALLLGGIGAHKFYLNKAGQGLLYLCFVWTFIPAGIAFIEGIIYLTQSDEEFQQKYVD